MYQNIPAELKALPQWVVTDASKRPYNPRTRLPASPTNSATWATFEEAVNSGAPHIGFVLTGKDPYCIIDLDNKPDNPATPEQLAVHEKILTHFQSYTEWSASGTGYHIVVKGYVPSGVNRDHVEVYSNQRYMIFTGNVVRNLPISSDFQTGLDDLHRHMVIDTARAELEEVDEELGDLEIAEMAGNADNAEKFNQLYRGDWEAMGYGSQSEADFALLSMYTFYSKSNEQCRRLFRMSELGQREKAMKNDTYLNYALGKIRAKQEVPVDLDDLKKNFKIVNGAHTDFDGIPLDLPSAHISAPPPIPTESLPGVSLPPGLVGELAQWVYQTSIRPVPEIALATAIALVAGITGRAYNISKSGLSQYMVLLAKTGTGKEAAASAISELLQILRAKVPNATDFYGPGVMASGPGLHRALSKNPCFVSIFGEFGLLLQKMTNAKANMADQSTMKLMLDIYGKSGFNQTLKGSSYSNSEKDVADLSSPNLTILGESTPESFYDSLDESFVTSGFLPRFFIIEYNGERPKRNPNAGMPPSESLLGKLQELIVIASQAHSTNNFMPVQTDYHAQQILDKFDEEVDERMLGQTGVLRYIWNRAHLKALKLAGLIAVGCFPMQPVVTEQIATWAIGMIRDDSERLAKRFNTGDIGEGDAKQHAEVLRVAMEYLSQNNEASTLARLHTVYAIKTAGLIPLKYFQRRLLNISCFKHDRRGANESLNKALQALKDSGQMVEMDTPSLKKKFDYEGRAFALYQA